MWNISNKSICCGNFQKNIFFLWKFLTTVNVCGKFPTKQIFMETFQQGICLGNFPTKQVFVKIFKQSVDSVEWRLFFG